MDTVKIKKESKNKIRVDFERAPLWERIKSKYFSWFFLKKVVYLIFKLVLLLGVSYVILFPYFTKIFNSFMTASDFKDVTVILLSKNPTLDQYKYIILENNYFKALGTTFAISFTTAFIQTLVCSLVAYGLAKFKFRGRNILFIVVIFSLMVPLETIQYSMKIYFQFFGTTNPIGMLLKSFGVIEQGLENTYLPMYFFSFTGFGFRNGLYIFMLRQFFNGVPDELEESAYIDGSNAFKTFFRIILPISIPMLITVFIFSFAWTWTDDFYVNTFFTSLYWTTEDAMVTISRIPAVPSSLLEASGKLPVYQSAIRGTGTILIALPLIIVYVFLQDKIVQGVERSGIVG